ncbi:mechanosensitive ion channel domain-containing protein [uncultured Clostridium sp.]|uniref:mechanosensitive ion channel family protein n=1 Tax=uncultured Clostridium sp. TaxID=59620 RepID=UPI0028F04CB3|nr:mechanosensitive ion channel domain-containing protein [uncultured Clostridium sp.]
MNIKDRILGIFTSTYGLKIIELLVVLFIGSWIIRVFLNIIDKALKKSKIDISLHSFIKSIVNISLRIILFLTIASMLGVPITTFLAVLSAAGLAVGLALKDSLTNFAGGILLLIFRPFSVGDYIETQGYSGTVNDIQLLYTYMNTADNKKIIIPNGELANGKIINYSSEEHRRVDLKFGISYHDDILKAKSILKEVINSNPLIFKDPEPFVAVGEYGDRSINLIIKVWCNNSDYWNIYHYLQEEVKLAFDREGITIPFPQMDVHMYNK